MFSHTQKAMLDTTEYGIWLLNGLHSFAVTLIRYLHEQYVTLLKI